MRQPCISSGIPAKFPAQNETPCRGVGPVSGQFWTMGRFLTVLLSFFRQGWNRYCTFLHFFEKIFFYSYYLLTFVMLKGLKFQRRNRIFKKNHILFNFLIALIKN